MTKSHKVTSNATKKTEIKYSQIFTSIDKESSRDWSSQLKSNKTLKSRPFKDLKHLESLIPRNKKRREPRLKKVRIRKIKKRSKKPRSKRLLRRIYTHIQTSKKC